MAGRLLRYRYELEALLSDGGLFATWKAVDKVRGATVVVKLLTPERPLEEPAARQWVRRLGALRGNELAGSPALVEIAKEGSGVVLVREHIDGTPLERWMTRARSYDEVLRGAIDVLRLAARWHAAGEVHGYLHPGNIVLRRGLPVFCDHELTAITREVLGVLPTRPAGLVYLAPEVRAGLTPVPASDVYSVGVVLWELLTGRRLAPGTAPVKPSEVKRDLPPSIDVVVEGMLRPQPDERYPAAQAADALAKLRERGEAVETRRQRDRPEPAVDLPRAPLPRPITVLLWCYRALFVLLGTVLVSTATLAGLGAGTYNYLLRTRPAEVIIPDVAGWPKEKAQALFEKQLGLVFQVRPDAQPHKTIAAGAVISVRPEPGHRVRAGRPVEVFISSGPALLKIPKFDELTLADAQEQVRQKGLRLGTVNKEVSDTVPAGYVMKQEPAAGTKADPGAAVNFWVSTGPRPESETKKPEPPAKGAVKHSGRVEIKVPAQPQMSWVKIVVTDDRGEHVVHQDSHPAGEVVRVRVEGLGQTVVEVYLNGDCVEKKVL